MALIAAIAILCAFSKLWLFLAAWAYTTYAALFVVALPDIAAGCMRAAAFRPTVRSVLTAPIALLHTGKQAKRTSAWPVYLALASSINLVALWGVWKYLGMNLSMSSQFIDLAHLGERAIQDLRDVTNPQVWKNLATWEAWSLARWWLFYGFTALCVAPFSSGSKKMRGTLRRLLAFSPWLIVVEVGFLFGAWLARGEFSVVPEPGTIFSSFYNSWSAPFLGDSLKFWLIRSAPPVFAASCAFATWVVCWRARNATVFALLSIPPAAVLSILWSALYVLGISRW